MNHNKTSTDVFYSMCVLGTASTMTFGSPGIFTEGFVINPRK